jgi:hypothetical protein
MKFEGEIVGRSLAVAKQLDYSNYIKVESIPLNKILLGSVETSCAVVAQPTRQSHFPGTQRGDQQASRQAKNAAHYDENSPHNPLD